MFFDDAASYFEFKDNAHVDLSAPVYGPMAGMVVSAQRLCVTTSTCSSIRKFSITSANVRSLPGTIYIPLDELLIDTTMTVSGEAAFTIIVVGNLLPKQSPTLVLNTNCDATNVPVPAGFAGVGGVRIVD